MIDYLHILGVSGEFSDSEEMGRYYSTSLPPSVQPLPAPSFIVSHPDPPPSASYNVDSFVNLNDKVSPSILLIIIILAIVFFVSGLLHLLVRFLWRPQTREPDDYLDNVTALQGQLQQLFHLHDAGVDQSYIDTLPVFHYKAIIGLKNPFDCAVCLCEFEPEDQLRLLPKCSHAFHVDCIDTWLLSHSTCPLCRATLLPDFSPTTNFSPFVFVLESGSDTSREMVPERENNAVGRTSTHSREFGSTRVDLSHKSDDLTSDVITVKLGKFRNVDNNGGEGSSVVVNSISDARRCFSMGSFAYVMEENSSLQVPVRATTKKPASKKAALPLTPGHRYAMSECDCESTRDFKFVGLDHATRSNESNGVEIFSGGAAIGGSRKESFSVSKIWLQEKKPNNERVGDSSSSSSRRAVSFRFSGLSIKNGKLEKWENDEENQSCYSVDSQGRAPSFARRTLLWLTGRQNKVVHSSSASNS